VGLGVVAGDLIHYLSLDTVGLLTIVFYLQAEAYRERRLQLRSVLQSAIASKSF
jgi:hypothetical protein